MAMVRCDSCGATVSTSDSRCPRCGYAPGYDDYIYCSSCKYYDHNLGYLGKCTLCDKGGSQARACPGFRHSY